MKSRQTFLAAALFALACFTCSSPIYNPAISAAIKDGKSIASKAIVSFGFASPAAQGAIDEATHTIAVSVPFGTDLSALTPTIVQTGASVSPPSGKKQNFMGPVDYTVTALDSSTQRYTATVTVATASSKDITSFVFASALNAPVGVSSDCIASITGTAIGITVPFGTTVTNLKATFGTTGASVKVGATPQTSDVTANDFSGVVIYTVTAADASTKTYAITVTVAPNSSKDITSFGFLQALNSVQLLSADRTATIVGLAIDVTVPFGTNVNGLVATFSATGASVKVGAITQTSGISANDFSAAVPYTVTAADASLKVYTVTVTIAPNSAKAITAFDFMSIPSLGTVTEGTHSISLTVPYGTNLASLAPTIAISPGASVSPTSLAPTDFRNMVTYTVTAADSSIQNYAVSVYVAGNPYRISAPVYNGPVWSSTDGGTTWSSGGPSLNWTHIIGSSDGTKLIGTAGAYLTPSSLYRSIDSGANWTILSGIGSLAFSGLSSSDNGAILGANVYDGTQDFFYSRDSGATWNQTTISGGSWWSQAQCSGDGLKWIGCNGGDGSFNVYIWTGTYDGALGWSWTATTKGYTSEGNQNPSGWAITKDGSKLFITFGTTGYISTNSGTTWTPLPSYPPGTSLGTPMTASAMSGDGSKLVVVVNDLSLFTSTNGGSTWTVSGGLPGSGFAIRKPVLSYDGTIVAVLAINGANSYIHISTDGGTLFSPQTGPGAGGQSYWYDLYVQSK